MVAPTDKTIFADSVAFHPHVVHSSVRGLVTPPAITTATKPLTLDQIHEMIAKYGPMLNLHPDEKFLNTSIEEFLSHCDLVDKKTKAKVKPTAETLPQTGKDDQYYLELSPEGKKGDFSTAKAYVHALWTPGHSYTDLQFWLFNAYNGPGTLHIDGLVLDSITSTGDINVAPLGEHVGDWEMIMVRVNNVTLQIDGIWLSEHAKGQFLTAENIPLVLKFQGTQPIIFSALNGHGNFPHVGPNPTESRKIGGIPAGFSFFVRNDSSDKGLKLDCSKKYELISADWAGVKPPAWVTYPFRWGPEGTSTHIKPVEVTEIVKAAAGEELEDFLPVAAATVLASEILPHFIKGDINGPASPSKHGTWHGTYPTY